jgi:hypothetical protein
MRRLRNTVVERARELLVPIANQESNRFGPVRQGPRQLPRLLDDPRASRMCGAAADMYVAAPELDEEQHVQPFQPVLFHISVDPTITQHARSN